MEEYTILQEYLEGSKGEKVYPDSHLEIDLSMDSLDMVELIAFLEGSFGVKLSEEELVDLKTPLALIKAVHSKTKEVVAKDSSFKKILEECDDVKLPVSSWVGKVAHILFPYCWDCCFPLR